MYDKNFYNTIENGSLRSARIIVNILFDKYHPRSVIDVGCGTGAWLKIWQDSGVNIFGVEGDWVEDKMLLVSKDNILKTDLSKKLILQEKFDLVVTMEVAEHLPPASADIFIQSLTSFADRVVFSAAVPGQGGKNHLNEQWPKYWADIFAKYGFGVDDSIRYQIWEDENIEWWYRQNILVFEKGRQYYKPLALVHPHSSYRVVPELGLRQLIKKIVKRFNWLNL
jgi:SAM-dependent methyltransferase